jgi:hypothetical protein
MTDDIVTRLRRHADAGVPSYIKQLDTEAADEIERLREQVNTIANAQDGWGRVPRLEAEIERLRADSDRWKRLFIELYPKNNGVTDEMMWTYRNETGKK